MFRYFVAKDWLSVYKVNDFIRHEEIDGHDKCLGGKNMRFAGMPANLI